MDTKQKSLLVLTIAALGFLGYQVFQLVDRDITETPVIAEQQHEALVNTPAAPASAGETAPATISSIAKLVPPPSAVTTPSAVQQPVVATDTITPQQHAYINALNSYEIARMHRQLLDEEAAIASAQQKIALLHDKTAKIVGTDGLSTETNLLGQSSDAFSLSYIDKQDGQWSAMLHLGSAYESVKIGTQLPDGFNVIGIDNQGVTLQNGPMRERITFNGTSKLPALTQAPSSMPQQTAFLESKQTTGVAQAVPVTHGVLGDQANLLTLQLAHQGNAVQSMARHGLDNTPAQPANTNSSHTLSTQKRSYDGLPYQISIHDANAVEGADDLDNTQLSMDLHLRSVEIMPVMNQAYNTNAYLPQQVSVPQTYHLDADSSKTADEQQYSNESSDAEALVIQKAQLTKSKVLKLPSDFYTIQLLGSPEDTLVTHFIQQNHLNHVALMLSVGNDAHPWVVALYGVYHSFDEAEEKLVQLPETMRSGGAWIRRIGDVQKVLESNHA